MFDWFISIMQLIEKITGLSESYSFMIAIIFVLIIIGTIMIILKKCFGDK